MTLEELRHGSYKIEAPDEDIKPTIDTIEAIKTQAAFNLGRYQEETRRWQQEGEASGNQRGRPRSLSHLEEQATRQNAQEMGRTFPSRFDGKTRGLQASYT